MVNQKSIKEIHKNIRNITIKQKNDGLPYYSKQEKFCTNLIKILNKKISNANLDDAMDLSNSIGIIVFDVYRKYNVYQNMKSLSYEYAKDEESKMKDETLKQSLDDTYDYLIKIDWGNKDSKKIIENAKIFYLASSHNDCASDHFDYQGKIYIDENWKRLIKDKDVKQEISDYVNSNGVKTFQWVIGKPVWFITRPNCRHYFKKLSLKEVLSTSVGGLINRYNMHHEIGSKDNQTIRHNTNQQWYTKENVQNIIDKYEERLSYHKALYSVQKTEDLKKAIDKDNLLIKKWKSYLQNMN